MNAKQKVYEQFKKEKITYRVVEHKAIYTMEEANSLALEKKEEIVKNLFLRDDKKKNYYLLVVKSSKTVDLKSLREKVGARPLSFASEEDLQKMLGVCKGAVTPLGIWNDEQRKVTVVLDEDLFGQEEVGVHPNDNTATVFLKPKDLEKIIENHGNKMIKVII